MALSSRSQRKVNTIIEQASRLFVRHGYHNVTMESIAQYANVSKVTLYKYFKDKQTLYEHIILLNSTKDLEDIKTIISDFIPYPDKVHTLFQFELTTYYDQDRPNLEDDTILSLETEKAIKKYHANVKKQRQKLYNQGRMEEFINEDIPDAVLELYYSSILLGLIKNYNHIEKLSEEEKAQLYTILYKGIIKSHE